MIIAGDGPGNSHQSYPSLVEEGSDQGRLLDEPQYMVGCAEVVQNTRRSPLLTKRGAIATIIAAATVAAAVAVAVIGTLAVVH